MCCSKKNQKGGSGTADWGAKVWGSGDAQTAIPGTNQILAKDPLAGSSGGNSAFSAQPYSGGASRKRRSGKKNGGMALSELIVPGVLLYAAKAYGKRGTKKTQGGKRKSRKARRSSKNRK